MDVTTTSGRRFPRLVIIVLVIGLVTAAFVARELGLRHRLAFQLRDHIGAPEDVLPFESFSLDDSPHLRLAAAGDVGTGDEPAFATAAAMDRIEGDQEYAALLLLGDNVYPNGDPDDVDDKVFAPYGDVLDGGTQLLAVLGNHDVRDENADAHAEAIGMPGRWYATRIDDVLIISLDSNQPENREQVAWLEETLVDSDARWTIVTMHHPPYSGGYHGSDHGVRNAFSGLFEAHDVQLVLAGHDHDYQRSRPIDGVTYIVSGGGATVRPASSADFIDVAFSTLHFLDIAVWPDRIEIRAVDQGGNQFDHITLDGPSGQR